MTNPEPVQDPAKTLQIANTTHANMLPSLVISLNAFDDE
jgi:hypothetical protein